MAKLIMRDQKVWLGAFDLSGVANSLAVEIGADARDVSTLGNATRIHLAGLKTLAAGMQGWFDTAGGLDQELFDRIGLADAPMSYAPVGAAEGDAAFSFLALHAQYSPQGAVGEVFAFNAAALAASGDGLVQGTLMHNSAETATANGTGQQLGAAAAGQKLFGALHVLDVSGGTPTLDVTVESDDNGGFTTPTTQITFAQQVAAGYEWAAPIAGPITDDWWRLAWTITGTTPSFEFVATLAIQ